MIQVDCNELTSDEELALTAELTEALKGKGMAFVKGRVIVFDDFGPSPLDEGAIESAVRDFISRRKDAQHYSCERRSDTLVVHSPDPIAAAKRRKPKGLPPNVYQCPFCPFITPYQELYVVHYRSHGFV